jgi:ATP-dependent phosphoenolpyruvate carboxykinase
MNLLEIPHFGWGKDVNRCVKQLLERVHGGFLWMDRLLIDVDLIANITGVPTDGVNPEDYFDDKMKEKAIVKELKSQFGTDRGRRGMIIKNINDPAT